MSNRIVATRPEPVELSQVRVINDLSEIHDTYALYLDDESHSFDGNPEAIVFPTSEAEISAVLADANRRGVPVTVQGARTGLTGGAVPLEGIALNLERMTRYRYIQYDEANDTYLVGAEPGVSLEDFVHAVKTKQIEFAGADKVPGHDGAWTRFQSDPRRFTFPVDPTESSALLGGIVACNASGARTFRYGAVRRWVTRVRVVLMNGDVLDIRRGQVTANDGKFEVVLSDGSSVMVSVPTYQMPQTKNAAGLFARPDMDLIDLFVGCEGILGVFSLVELRVAPVPENTMSIMAFFPSEEDAVGFVEDLRGGATPLRPELIEYLGPNAVHLIRETAPSAGIRVPVLRDTTRAIVYFEFPYSEEDMESYLVALEECLVAHNSSSDMSWAAMDSQDEELQRAVRHLVPETVNATIAKRKSTYHEVHKIGTDMAVPDEALWEYLHFYRETLEREGLEHVVWGHIGNNHLHVNILPRDPDEVHRGMELYRVFAEKAVQLGGTVAAEHGIGKLKRPFLQLMYGEEGIREIQAVKQALDPKWLLNRENMVPMPG